MKSKLAIEILLWYFWSIKDHPYMDDGGPAWRTAIKWLLEEELLREETTQTTSYSCTQRGRVYVEAIWELPLPLQVWVMPSP